MNTVTQVVLWLLVAVAGISWVSTTLLLAFARPAPRITALSERAGSALCKSIGSSVIAVLVLNSYTHWFQLERPWTTLVLGCALLLLELPALVWLWVYRVDVVKVIRGEVSNVILMVAKVIRKKARP